MLKMFEKINKKQKERNATPTQCFQDYQGLVDDISLKQRQKRETAMSAQLRPASQA